ncbi:HDOD domain-containing protein [Chitinimonas lacunae]|uniref:HDOD domain-containing protein n=1 Tax=Chitinimonas lacunae TaxID=1963018 RepID=A0ABV8MPI7_9NEIS
MPASLTDLLEHTNRLVPMPNVVRELLASLNDEDADLHLLARKIARDQIIAARVLRLANSPHYGNQRQIASIDEAVVILGFHTLRTLVIAAGITGAFTPQGFDRVRFWRHSFEVAILARGLARQTGLGADLAFTCGLMHNLGELCVQTFSPETAEMLRRGGAELGFDFPQVGVALARQWHFPDQLAEAIGQQTAPTQGEPPSPLAAVLWLAQHISTSFAAEEDDETIAAALPPPLLALAGLDTTPLDELLKLLRVPEQNYAELMAT